MKNDFITDDDLELLNSVPVKDSKPIKVNKPKVSVVKSVEKTTPSLSTKNQDKREERRKTTAEDFTPKFLVNEMLDKLPKEVWEENRTFCDPACGNGNFLIEVLRRKLKEGHNPVDAIKSIYGVDIMIDNIKEAQLRLMKVIVNFIKENKLPKPNVLEIIKYLGKNIVCTPLSKYPNGSLDYDFEFKNEPSIEKCKIVKEKIVKNKLLDSVEI
jgi:hypothetical protein